MDSQPELEKHIEALVTALDAAAPSEIKIVLKECEERSRALSTRMNERRLYRAITVLLRTALF